MDVEEKEVTDSIDIVSAEGERNHCSPDIAKGMNGVNAPGLSRLGSTFEPLPTSLESSRPDTTPSTVQQNNSQHDNEPIAIVGMGCRLPGGATSPSKLWDLLINGGSGHCDMPRSRFNASGFYHPDQNHPVSVNSTGGYFIKDNIRSFDNSFFGINNLEATYMDPQQRQLLEVCFECFESAGVTLEQLKGADVGCYIANFLADFVVLQSKDAELFHRYSATGMGLSIMANRISNAFDLKGPSFVLDTACSSSLYALHTACSALRDGDCAAAIVAGANLVQTPELHLMMVKAGFLSPTSTCHTFDTDADGYGRGEGVGALYLKRLSDAIRDGDLIRSVIRGSAVNSNGHTNGITLPSVPGQEAVIRKAYAMAGLPTNETDYIEAHGTGTPVGDPIEVEAISRVFSRKSSSPTLIGSVKTNIGHGEAVSGISSIIKVTLALERGKIPPTIGIKQINPELKLQERNIEVVTSLRDWPERGLGHIPRASINSFGYGGANAHVILEAAASHIPNGYAQKPITKTTVRPGSFTLLPFSSHGTRALLERVKGVSLTFKEDLEDLAHTLGAHRTRLSTRGYILVGKDCTAGDISVEKLKTLDHDIQIFSPLPVAFVFTGQGAQWPRMGHELISAFPIYRATIQALDSYLLQLAHPPSWNIEDALLESPETSEIHRASHSQTICTATQIALVALLRDWKIIPQAVIGHSSGEISAAFAAGYVTAAEAIAIAYYRGLAVTKVPVGGAMAALGLSRAASEQEIAALGLEKQIRVACVNSPESSTISGDSTAIDLLITALADKEIFTRKLKTDNKAYHSYHMLSVGKHYEDLVSSIYSRRTTCNQGSNTKMFSSVTGHLASKKLIDTPEYWRENLECPVLFSSAMQELLSETSYQLIEIGPHSALQQPIKQIQKTLENKKGQSTYSSTLTRGKNGEQTLLELCGRLFLQHQPIDVNNANRFASSDSKSVQKKSKIIHELPGYSWNHEAVLWNESRASEDFRKQEYGRHDLLGTRLLGTTPQNAQWKNQLKVEQVPWLADHKLGNTMIFPGAGYLVLAMEALAQLQNSSGCSLPGVIFHQVHIKNMLVLDDESDHMDIFTELKPSQISGLTTSANWWEFNITSVTSNMATVHACGSIAVLSEAPVPSPRLKFSIDSMEAQATRTWYDKLAKEGLRFGPNFRSLTKIYNDRAKRVCHTVSETPFIGGGAFQNVTQSQYLIHPITLDALFQTAIIASAGGSVPRLRGRVPVTISKAEIMAISNSKATEVCSIFADSENVGFGTININGEIRDSAGQVLVRIEDLRAIAYDENLRQVDLTEERNPILRVLWKPNLSTLSTQHTTQLTEYTDRFAHNLPSAFRDSEIGRFAGVVDILTHSDARLRILELGNHSMETTALLLDLLHSETPLKRFQTYTKSTAVFGNTGRLVVREVHAQAEGEDEEIKNDALFDAIIIPPPATAKDLLTEQTLKYLKANGTIIYVEDSCETPTLKVPLRRVISTSLSETRRAIVIARPLNTTLQHTTPPAYVIFVHRNKEHKLNSTLHTALSKYFQSDVKQINLEDVAKTKIPVGSIIITSLEIEDPILESATPKHIEDIKVLTDNASILVWITGGALFKSKRPSFSLVGGLARSLMLEQPSLKFYTVDLDDLDDCVSSTANIMSVLKQAIHNPKPELEYLQHEKTLYSSRFVPEQSSNKRFRRGQNGETVPMSLKEAGHCELGIKRTGQLDSLHFNQRSQRTTTVDPGYVEVQVKAIGLNAKDFYALHGKVDTKQSTCSCEFSGVINKVGSSESQFSIGDRVVVMAPTHFATYETVPEWACCHLKDNEDFETCSTIPLVFATALYALKQRARLQPRESVLIHSAAGGLGLAAIQIAKLQGAEIFATVGTQEKRDFLVRRFGLQENRIFSSRDSTFLHGVLAATSGRGVDVVLNSLTGDLLHDSWRACAEFGRFVEVGKRDILDGGKLDMAVFERGVTFTAFDLSNMFWSKSEEQHRQWADLLKSTMSLYRSGDIIPIDPLKVFDASEVVQAFRYFALATRVGKIAVSFKNPQSQIPVVPIKFRTSFYSHKSYLLIGCLGGLGRSISKWMFQQGARKFVFMGRSGIDRAPARDLVNDLKVLGAEVTVVRGTVSSAEDVERTFAQIRGPIGGVIQAAMGLALALFTEMTSDVWHSGIDQKVQGTWNLHNSLANRSNDLDFFLTTSSISGSIGVATESNYCAANGFLDAFARYRRSVGLRATSLGLGMISEVGFLHENPEIEALLLRKGVHPIDEDELLQLFDMALTPDELDVSARNSGDFPADHFAEGHILTGLELLGLQKIRAMGWERPTAVLDDPRTTIIAGAYAAASTAGNHQNASADSDSGIPATVVTALQEIQARHPSTTNSISEKEGPCPDSGNTNIALDEPLILAIQDIIATKACALLLISPKELTPYKHLSDFGMDSMLASEFRGAVFRLFRVDVPFVTLLDKRASIRSLAELVGTKLLSIT